jgi:hypothetical protein
MPAWGNHEWEPTDDLRNYKGRFDFANPQTSPGSPSVSCCGEDWYWFDYGNARFIAYPEPWSGAWSDWNTKARVLMDKAQADPTIDFIVTFGHRPAYSSGHHPGSSTLKGILDALGDTHSKYVLNINGHSHNYERGFPQHGVVHVTVGTGGASLEQDGSCLWCTCTQPAWSAFRAMRLGALKLRFTDTRIEGTFICGPPGGGTNDVNCTEGSMVDTFVIGPPGNDSTPPTVSMIFGPTADATIKADSPDMNYESSKLEVDNSPVEHSLLKFSVSGVGTRQVIGAKLRLYTINDSNKGGDFYRVANTSWSESSVTWNTAPTADATPIASLGAVAINTWYEVDVTSLITGNGTYSLRVKSTSSDGADHHSKETVSFAPQLVLTLDTGGTADMIPPAVSITAPSPGATVSNTITVSANASDNVGVAGVQFKLDGNSLGMEDTTNAYAVSWDTTTATNGSHILTATARDTAGNITTSSTVTISVNNGGTIAVITDPTKVFSVPNVSKPSYLSPIKDPTFGTKMTRITDDNGSSIPGGGRWGYDVRQHYSKDPVWNADQTIMVLENRGGSPNPLWLDGETYQKLNICSAANDGMYGRWHPTKPMIRIRPEGNKIRWFDVVNCSEVKSITLPFSFGSGPDGGAFSEGTPSNDGRYAALAKDGDEIFVVDMDPPSGSPRAGPIYNVASCGLSDCRVDWVAISPSGKYAVVQHEGDHTRVFDINPTTLALTPRPMPSGSPQCGADQTAAAGYIFNVGHADMAMNPFDNNEDVIIGQRRSWCPSTVNEISMGSVVMVRLKDNKVTTLTDPSNEAYSYHVSTRNLARPGWAYVGYWLGYSGKRFNHQMGSVSFGK